MKCKKCKEKAVFQNPDLCKKHFIEYFEEKFYSTISKFSLIKKSDKIAVACSGGKDSTATLYLLAKKYKDVTALAIDEGIKDYRDKTLVDLNKFCKKNKIKLKVISFKKEFKKSLDQLVPKGKKKGYLPCTICGVMRRYLLNKYSRNFDVIVFGHNLDDEAQSIMMNFLRNNLKANARLGPRTGLIEDKKFTPRVKPLYFIKEKETMAYCFLTGILGSFNECPYVVDSFRAKVRDWLNKVEEKNPGTKENIIHNFLYILPKLKTHFKTDEKVNACKYCSEPSQNEVCKACLLIEELI